MSVLKVKNADGTWTDIPALIGPQGEQGPIGPEGPTGANGYTPIKGTDYFTEADKTELVADVEAIITTKGYQTEAQVNALITAALSNIGVAEEGSY